MAAAVLANRIRELAARARRAAPWVLAVTLALLVADAFFLERLPERWQPILRAAFGAVVVLCVHDAFGRRDRRALAALTRQTEVLRASEARLEEAQAIAHVGSWELDLSTRRLTWSAERFRLHGLEPRASDVAMTEGLALVHPDDRPGLEAALQDLATSGGSYQRELRFLHADGSVRWVHSRAQLVAGADGRPDRIVGTSQDITERKRAEAALLEREARLRLALEVAELGTWETDLETGATGWSPALERLFGLEPGTFGGSTEDFLAMVHPDDVDHVRRQMAEEIAGREEVRSSYRILRQGKLRHLTSLGGVLRDAEGRATRVLGVTQDVTSLREAEERRGLLFRGEKLRALGQMASGVAHDLNQQFAIISGYGGLAQMAFDCPQMDLPAVAHALRMVTRAATDGGKVVARLLAFSRDREEGPTERLDVRVLLEDVAELTAPFWRDEAQAAGRRIALRVLPDEPAWIEGWPHALREALTNLIVNAVDALPEGGTIRLAAKRDGATIRVEIADDGVGMPPHVQARLFEPFFTTKGERGTGLGLSGVYGIVDRHGGRIEVVSAPGCGTTFTLVLPAAAETRAPSPAEVGPVPEAAGLRVLAVEDEPALRRMLGTILERLGHAPVTAASGEEALQLLGEADFDLLLADLGLGEGMTGWELVERARLMNRGLRVVLVTGWGAQIDEAQARARGVHAVVAKPYSIETLRAVAAPRAVA